MENVLQKDVTHHSFICLSSIKHEYLIFSRWNDYFIRFSISLKKNDLFEFKFIKKLKNIQNIEDIYNTSTCYVC